MFLPRASASASSSSSKPDASSAPHSASPFLHSPKRYAIKSGQGASWSQPTTAPPSVQIHYHYLAGRYRDLSNERGLGLSSSGMPTSSSMATLGGILEGDRDEAGSIEGDARSINLQPSPNGKSQSASSSLRAIAHKTGVGKKEKGGSHSNRLQDLFAGGRTGEGKDKKQQQQNGDGSPTKADRRRSGTTKGIAPPHGGKHASLRSYAEERIKAQEAIEATIQKANDTGRLKWEARAAMLNSSFALAILLYVRAAQIGSISAALSLSYLYATGLTRGNKPVVVLVHRDPLRSMAWALEAARLLQQRTNARAKKQGAASAHWSKAELEQPAQIVALLARLLRCRQMGLTARDEVKLPVVRRRRPGKEKEQGGLVWDSVCESMEWLDQHLTATVPSPHDDEHSIGPDDDDDDPATIKANQARTHVTLVKALVATKRLAAAQGDDDKVLSQVASSWRKFAEVLRSEGRPHESTQGDLEKVCHASEKIFDKECDARRLLEELVDALDSSLVESATAVAANAAETTFAHLESPSKRAIKQTMKQRASLEELMPFDAHTMRKRERARRPSLLRHRPSSGEAKPTIMLAFGEAAPVRLDRGISRTLSLQGGSQRPGMSSSTSMSQLESQSSLHPRQHDKRTLQRAKRPSSVMSASPSLLFAPRGNVDDEQKTETAEDKDVGLPAISSVVSSLWKAAPLQTRQPSQSKSARERVVSLYGAASVAPSEKIHTSGTTTDAYDIDVALSRQQTRRRRGDSNASISTLASMLSTNASVSASVTGSEYARGQFLSPSSSSNNLTGFDFRAGGAAESLRRIRKASMSSQIARDTPTTPHLSDTLEDIIANSASYRAANAKAAPPTRKRRDSNASMKSLTAFTGNNQRQTSYGDMRAPSLFQGRANSVLGIPAIGPDRGSSAALRSPTLSLSTSYFNVTPQLANGTVQSRSRAPSQGAIGSLRLLGRQFSSQSEPKTTTTTFASLASKERQDNGTIKQSNQPAFSSPGVAPSKLEDYTKVSNANHHQRSFEAFDPTHSSSRLHSQAASPAGSIQNGKSKPSSHVSNSSNGNLNNSTTLDPALAQAEERSGLKTTSACMVCHHKVVNAPVTKSGDVFCSRDCRLEMKRIRTAEAKGKAKEPTQ